MKRKHEYYRENRLDELRTLALRVVESTESSGRMRHEAHRCLKEMALQTAESARIEARKKVEFVF